MVTAWADWSGIAVRPRSTYHAAVAACGARPEPFSAIGDATKLPLIVHVYPAWTRASILNVARMAWFSSDRTIREYADDIWNVPVGPIQAPAHARRA